jgi:hypothetical protein
MITVDQVIAAFGGPTRLAERLTDASGKRVGVTVVSAWKTSGRIPSWWLPLISDLLERDGRQLSARDVLALSAARPRAKAEAA